MHRIEASHIAAIDDLPRKERVLREASCLALLLRQQTAAGSFITGFQGTLASVGLLADLNFYFAPWMQRRLSCQGAAGVHCEISLR